MSENKMTLEMNGLNIRTLRRIMYGCFPTKLAGIAKEMTGLPNLTQTILDILNIFRYHY